MHDYARSQERRAELIAQTNKEQVRGQLNPDWVECLMGFPVGWTDLDCAEPRDMPWPAPPGPQHDWEPPRIVTGKKKRAARLRAIGNAVVPQVAEFLGRWIIEKVKN